ncbi:SHOCT-like domain-containing protein [Symbiobacterium thermophilum]|nr:hypothetical protein [Symbiobacterium thermophilum]
MQEDRLMVLQMLADGRLTVEEADTLLRSLEETAAHADAAGAGPARRADSAADRHEPGARLRVLLQQMLDEANAALDRALRSVEERLAELERREPYRQIRQLADSLDRVAAREAVREARAAAKEAVREARAAAKEAVEEALEEVEEKVADAIETAKEAVADAIEAAEEAVADALEAAEEAVADAAHAAEEAEENVRFRASGRFGS